MGVVRSPLQPEEVYGLSRSGDLSRMLPSEMALLAHGWPRKAAPAGPGGPRNSSSSSEGGSSRDGGGGDAYSSVGSLESGDLLEEEYYLPGEGRGGGGGRRAGGGGVEWEVGMHKAEYSWSGEHRGKRVGKAGRRQEVGCRWISRAVSV